MDRTDYSNPMKQLERFAVSRRLFAAPQLLPEVRRCGPWLLVLFLFASGLPRVLGADAVAPVSTPVEVKTPAPTTNVSSPVATTAPLFAKDLVIGSYFGSKNDPTLIIVNTASRERMSLKHGVPAANGMMLKSLSLSSSRKNVSAEVTLNGETAILRFDISPGRPVAPAAGKASDPAPQPVLDPSENRDNFARKPAGGPALPPGTEPSSPHPVIGPHPFPIVPGQPLPKALYDSGAGTPAGSQ